MPRVAEKRRERKGGAGEPKPRFDLFLNPYEGCAFTRCPQCNRTTKVRMHCLLIHIEPTQLVSFNKSCRLCARCGLLIVRKAELKAYLAAVCTERGRPELVGNEYLVVGTIDRALHRKGKKGGIDPATAAKACVPLRKQVEFTPGGGWELPGG
jgi:hypothetical protein